MYYINTLSKFVTFGTVNLNRTANCLHEHIGLRRAE